MEDSFDEGGEYVLPTLSILTCSCRAKAKRATILGSLSSNPFPDPCVGLLR